MSEEEKKDIKVSKEKSVKTEKASKPVKKKKIVLKKTSLILLSILSNLLACQYSK